MSLCEKLRSIRMHKGGGIDPFLTRIQVVRDQMEAIREAP